MKRRIAWLAFILILTAGLSACGWDVAAAGGSLSARVNEETGALEITARRAAEALGPVDAPLTVGQGEMLVIDCRIEEDDGRGLELQVFPAEQEDTEAEAALTLQGGGSYYSVQGLEPGVYRAVVTPKGTPTGVMVLLSYPADQLHPQNGSEELPEALQAALGRK